MTQLTNQDREKLLIKLLLELYSGQISEGALLRRLRKDVLGLNQEGYAKLVGVSRRTLSDVERDQGQLTMSVYAAVFKPLGLKPGLLPRSDRLLKSMISTLGQ